ncbi:MAG TPA: hypothetical protein VHK23_06555 [Miltoncostaeaceae bacterium]|nr:hypothetical protein [Miltoncostaeaceae bacterium]
MPDRNDRGVMEGGGYYAAHSDPQRGSAAPALPMLERAAAEAALPPPGAPLVVADMGAAQGRNELEPLSLAVRGLAARRSPGTPISSSIPTLPGNDFGSLFALVEGDPGSYLREAGDVYPYVAGRSFYGRLFPDDHLTLGWTAIAVHWLSGVPAALPGTVYSEFATGGVAEAFRERARRDWLAFLSCRARELRPGGELVVVGGAAAPDGSSGAAPLLGTLSAEARAMVDAGELSAAELARMTVPTWNRTPDEFAEPFREGAVALELVELEASQLPDRFLAALERDGDREAFAAAVTGFVRAFTEPSLLAALDPGRDPAERRRIGDELYERVRARAAARPEDVRADWRVVAMRIRRPAAVRGSRSRRRPATA